MTTAIALTPGPRAGSVRWLAIALSCSVHLTVLALLVGLGRFSPSAVSSRTESMVVEIVSLTEPVAPRAAAQPSRPDRPPATAEPETRDLVGEDPPPPPASVAKNAEPLWGALAPLPPVRPAAVGKRLAVQNIGDLAALAGKKITQPMADGNGAAIRRDVAISRTLGGPSPKPAAGNPAPRYPARAQRRGWQGRVLLRLAITGAGRVADISVVQSSGHAVLDRAAEQTLKYWRFETTFHGVGTRTFAEVTVPVVFRLHGEDGVVVDTKIADR